MYMNFYGKKIAITVVEVESLFAEFDADDFSFESIFVFVLSDLVEIRIVVHQ